MIQNIALEGDYEQLYLSVALFSRHSLFKDIKPPRLNGNTQGLPVLAVLEAPVKHPVHDRLQPLVDVLLPCRPLRRVAVDALSNYRLHVSGDREI